jgi:hypothetical protein
MPCRFIAPCCRPWGSPRFRLRLNSYCNRPPARVRKPPQADSGFALCPRKGKKHLQTRSAETTTRSSPVVLHPSKLSPLAQPFFVTESHHRQVDDSTPSPPKVPSRRWLPTRNHTSTAHRPKPANRFHMLPRRSPRPQGFTPHQSPLLNAAVPHRCCHL